MTKKKIKKEPKAVNDPRLVTQEYTLIDQVVIDGKQLVKGDKVKLTHEGKIYFKSINKI